MARSDALEVNGRSMRVGVATPSSHRAPGVLVMIHGPGLDAFIEAQLDDLAEHGYVAAAPDVFHRQPDDGADALTRVGRLLDQEILDDADAAVTHLRSLPDASVGRLAVLGFCMGGRNTYLLAGARPTWWSAAAVFYGGNILVPWGNGPSPFDLTDRIRCPIIGIFGADDSNPSPNDVNTIAAELTRHDKPHEFRTYAGAGHAFLNFTSPERHRPEQARDAWSKVLDFLDHHLHP